MKQRMHNFFFRVTKIDCISNLLATVGYCVLKIIYYIVRIALYNKKNVINNEQAFEIINKKNIVLNYDFEIVNNPYDNKTVLSIIMPAYNVEKYILESIDSIIGQNISYEYELIIVNDGSTDGTREILNNLNHPCIRVIEQKNGGLSLARNTGLDNAVGKYVMFVDSDDVLEDGSIEALMKAIISSKADVSIGGYYVFDNNSNAKQYMQSYEKTVDEDADKIVFNPGYAWGKVFERQLFYNVRFPVGAWFEDTLICSVIYRKCKRMAKIPNYVYGYRQNNSGITKTARKSYKALDHIWVMKDAIEQAHRNGLKDDEYLYELCLGHFSSILYRRISFMDKKTKNSAFVVAASIMNELNVDENIRNKKRGIEGDIEKAFRTGNYKLWKWASFVV